MSRQQWLEQRANDHNNIRAEDVVDIIFVVAAGSMIVLISLFVGGLLWILT